MSDSVRCRFCRDCGVIFVWGDWEGREGGKGEETGETRKEGDNVKAPLSAPGCPFAPHFVPGQTLLPILRDWQPENLGRKRPSRSCSIISLSTPFVTDKLPGYSNRFLRLLSSLQCDLAHPNSIDRDASHSVLKLLDLNSLIAVKPDMVTGLIVADIVIRLDSRSPALAVDLLEYVNTRRVLAENG